MKATVRSQALWSREHKLPSRQTVTKAMIPNLPSAFDYQLHNEVN
jgi:hypothetical protein